MTQNELPVIITSPLPRLRAETGQGGQDGGQDGGQEEGQDGGQEGGQGGEERTKHHCHYISPGALFIDSS